MNDPRTHLESAASYRWLAGSIGLHAAGGSRCASEWTEIRDSMRSTTQVFASIQDWISDFWMCRSAETTPGLGLVPKWAPPDELDGWSGLELVPPGRLVHESARWTSHARFGQLLRPTGGVAADSGDATVHEFYALDDASRHDHAAMVRAEHVRAWLSTALGNLLSSIVLTPQSSQELLVAESRRRLLIPRALHAAPEWGVQFLEGEIGILYNCRQSPQGSLSWGGIRIGQGEEWLRHWQWLSVDAEPAEIASAVALAARLMRCRPLLDAILAALGTDDRELRQIAVAVVRRWLLALKAMAWLEDALSHPWRGVRPRDLACFAYNAVKPDWPRRVVALSHRSLDAKPTLQALKAWRSSLFAIDANYAPSWETNLGMMWGLFAAAPVIVRVRSPHYEQSPWCEREAEIVDHLERTCDFLAGRQVLDVGLQELASLDRIVDSWRPLSIDSAGHRPEFPPLSVVYVAGAGAEWSLALLRAAGALRVFQAAYGDPRIVNRLAEALFLSDGPIPIPPPTNNPGGWADYGEVFRALPRECGLTGEELPLRLPAGAQPWHPEQAAAFAEAIPDLSQGSPALADVLAALEWRVTLLPMLEEESSGDMTLVDLRGVDRERWTTDPRLSLARGIAALRAPPRPVWFIQLAGQRADEWGLPSDRPIFTQYNEGQFAWMLEASFSPDWPASFAERCGLEVSAELLRRCHRGTRRLGDVW